MLLALDIGNTNIKSAIFNNDSLNEFKTHHDLTSAIKYIKHKNYSEAAICAVDPYKEKTLINEISKKNIPIFRSSVHSTLNLKIKYKTPDTLGMDRVCSAAGAYETALNKKLFTKSQYLLTIDFGTATTINVVSPAGEFIGGMIAPGIKIMLKSLNEQTARLPFPHPVSFKGLIGDSTNSSLISGVYTATIGMINEVINHLKKLSKGKQPIIFVTGGNSQKVLDLLKYKIFFEEALVLLGLKTIYELNK